MIAKALNIGDGTLSRNKQLKQVIQDGRTELAEKVTQSILESLDDSQTRLFISKRLKLFNPQICITKPTTAAEALDNLSTAIKQYADGEINESQLRTIEAISNSYIKGCDFIEFEKRLESLEATIGATKND